MTSPRVLLAAHGLRPQKRWGQNFLSEPSTAQMIISRAGVGPDDVVMEIGPGLGALTLPLARTARKVYAIEKDRNLSAILRSELRANAISNVETVEADVLQLDWTDLAAKTGSLLTVFGNLPYNISSQIVIRLIESRRFVARAVLMFQRELADRLVATPGSKEYGRITAMLTYCAVVKHMCHVGAKRFYPVPQVDSEVLEIRFSTAKSYPAHDEAQLLQLIAAAFGKRRKTLKNALSASGLQIAPALAAQALVQAGIDPGRRAETLSPEEFVALHISLRSLAP
jgi:16S rRNA (adenine1518-N6/adenine1519-N6)-dimethyltransferase